LAERAKTRPIAGTQPTVRLHLADGNKTLPFALDDYVQKFGKTIGNNLFAAFSKVLQGLHRSTVQEVRTELGIIVWNHFGIKWTEIFKSNQLSRNVSPAKGRFSIILFY
jgi:hypothetical protein